MLTANQLRQVAARTGARDIPNVEIDVLLTHLLQLFHQAGLGEHVAFKGGTMLRKMIFGPTGRLSTDLDFTRRTDISADDLAILILDVLSEPFEGIEFTVEDRDCDVTTDSCFINPMCRHAGNERGIKIKLQVSTRERPVLPVMAQAQINQFYFDMLPFCPVAIPCLAFEEVVAEKVRAASQRSKIRDLHDLAELSGRALNRPLVRSLAILKMWNSRDRLDFDVFKERIEDCDDYDVGDLRNLLRRDQEPDLRRMTRRAVEGFRFLSDLDDLERRVAADTRQASPGLAEELATRILAPPAPLVRAAHRAPRRAGVAKKPKQKKAKAKSGAAKGTPAKPKPKAK